MFKENNKFSVVLRIIVLEHNAVTSSVEVPFGKQRIFHQTQRYL